MSELSNLGSTWRFSSCAPCEYRAKKVESQIRAPERIGALSEHISAIRGDTEWRLPTGKILWTHHVKGPDGKSHPQRTEEDIAGDTPQSSPGGPAGVSLNIAAGALGFSYSPGSRPTVGMLVSYRYASHGTEWTADNLPFHERSQYVR